jgi:hypothetical protein
MSQSGTQSLYAKSKGAEYLKIYTPLSLSFFALINVAQ